MTRAHAALCAGADEDLSSVFPEDTPQHPRHTRIDAVLNKYRNSSGDHAAYKACVAAIQKILVKCRGLRRRKRDGFWTSEPDSDDDDDNNNNNLQVRPVVAEALPPTLASQRQTQRNAAISLRRNRPRGRPRRPPSNDAG